ncbi:MAG: Hsp20/alpha crystallin family protein [Candidatus Dojkabacteria bacterium]
MRLTLARDPFTMASRLSNMISDEDMFGIDWDDTQLDMYEKEDKIVVKLKAPGFDEKNIDISIEGNSLTITGNVEHSEEEEDKDKKYYRKEIRNQSFTRSVSLPSKVIAEEADAHFKNGILHLHLPKAEEAKPKKISVKVK